MSDPQTPDVDIPAVEETPDPKHFYHKRYVPKVFHHKVVKPKRHKRKKPSVTPLHYYPKA